MRFLLRLLPNSLLGRVFSLYLASLVLFVCAGLGFFYQYQFSQHMEDELLAAEQQMSLAAQTVADSAVIGDYDTIAKTLDRVMVRSKFAEVRFIDASGTILKAVNQLKLDVIPPSWLTALVQDRLFDVNRNVVVGGKDYGVLRISFLAAEVAEELWVMVMQSLQLALLAVVVGALVIWVPLKRWLGNFDRVRAREKDILSGAIDVSALLDRDAPMEIRRTFEILSRAAGRLAAQREEAAVTLNAITDGVLTVDAQKRLLYCNPAAEHMLGISAAQLTGQAIPSHFADVVANNNVLDWQQRQIDMTGLDGIKMTLDTTFSTIYTGDKTVAGHVLTFRDVTQQHALNQQLRAELQMRQRALEALRQILDTFEPQHENAGATPMADDLESLTSRLVTLVNERERSRRALDNQKFALDQHAVVSISNLKGDIIYANDRFCDISGYSRAELLGANHRIVKSGFHPPEFFERMWQTITQGKVWHGEICNLNKRGNPYWVDVTLVPMLDSNGLPEQYIAIRTDISARKAAEAQLEEQLHFVEVLLEALPTALYLKDTAGRYLRFNKAFEDLFGVERSQWVGKTVFDLVPGQVAAMMDAKDQELYRYGETQTYEASFTQRSTGLVLDGLYRKAALTDSDGKITGLVGTILDITDRNRLSEALHTAKLRAEAANQAKSDFLANMSHEIRTPMNGVMGMTDLALDTPLSPEQRGYMEIVKSSAQSLMVILNDILDFSKIEAGKLNIESVVCSLPDILTDTLKTVEARVAKKGLALVCAFEPGLPERALADPGRIRQVLTNLCDNAIKFTAAGRVTVGASAQVQSVGVCEIHVWVRDTGIGIPKDKQQGVFEAFTQADASTTRRFGGTGLGLTICARLVGLMGGRIWVESEPGQGSTFHFTLMVRMAFNTTEDGLEVPAPGPEASPVPDPVRTLQVLLVEDHPVNQMVATVLLNRWGYTVVLAKNGQEAVDQFASQPWDLVLMDMQMPVMGGLEATRLIRASEQPGQHTPIIAMTANAMASDRQACLDAGMDDYVAKPFKAAILQAAVVRCLTPEAATRR